MRLRSVTIKAYRLFALAESWNVVELTCMHCNDDPSEHHTVSKRYNSDVSTSITNVTFLWIKRNIRHPRTRSSPVRKRGDALVRCRPPTLACNRSTNALGNILVRLPPGWMARRVVSTSRLRHSERRRDPQVADEATHERYPDASMVERVGSRKLWDPSNRIRDDDSSSIMKNKRKNGRKK
ncbi:hypothetical protein KIN20_031978 [Parelaphostrongylus tenuis]|uniref:Uncharacterized protein n=1 Tax=Parelaphostrongylus tenuis TaxID=148309 RepID=A0AAD5R5Y0_PARTN|nr:hypothetical protein KIN20_031978 [Parelaphostrongylus tenuis]